jgi:inhibitor of cysteine peptidase
MRKPTLTALIIVLAGFVALLESPLAGLGRADKEIGPHIGIQIAMQPSESMGKKTENPVADEAKSDKEDTVGTFTAAVGQELTVTLASNPTTGYHWELAVPLDEAIVKLVASEYKPPQTTLVGAGGQEIWTFRAIGRGETVISLKYVRPWEKDLPAARTASYTVTIH